uniref:Signal recognition particle 43 kDa protein n=1 Tax=Tetraselmis sp. GSL018 TaxID=582737 RepID=A0A061QSE4_9CHLO|eukprot:CAMPEP_0177614732 /NCGR_PEP_ID=MMETSP0419_2-20121207/22924_1 /TAXON_ID=582737 /ORGANISM="Tetraselmis sp., Strain GSL018" /LENGTH=428 /DNA_ID=CAMNT_0019112033 /DNA_START=204 /DNA_END=1490 /DNA_ORIENTATION=+
MISCPSLSRVPLQAQPSKHSLLSRSFRQTDYSPGLAARSITQHFKIRKYIRAQAQEDGSSQRSVVNWISEGIKFEKQIFNSAKQALKDSVIPQVYDPEKEEFEVEQLLGVRAMVEEDEGRPFVEYLVKWKDGSPSSWERATNISEDVLRDFENRWWTAAREGDLGTMKEMLQGGKKLLANTLDANRRCALHFTAAIGNADCTRLLLEYGADVNAADKEGYTPLHMAAGYLHTSTVIALLEAGADSEQKDNQGRDPLQLIDSLRPNLPPSVPQLLPKRAALEAVARVMVDSLFEDVEPEKILEERRGESGEREFLVRWKGADDGNNDDDETDSWVSERDLAEDVLADWDNGLEWADAAAILGKRRVDGNVQYLVKWKDGEEDTWEPEQNVEETLIRAYEDEQDKAKAQRRAARKAAAEMNGTENNVPVA